MTSESAFEAILAAMGAAGARMVQLGAAEGAAGNISVFTPQLTPDARFSPRGSLALPVAVPALADGWVVVTGSAQRLGDIARAPATTLCLLEIQPGGTHATLYGDATRPTTELNTHLAVHNDQIAQHSHALHAVVHAQPVRLTYLSHIERYADGDAFSRRLLRWQPETIIEFPEGIGLLPFAVPGSAEQMQISAAALRTYRAIVWRRHGIVTRATSIAKAADLVEYAEAAAHYEYLNLAAGEPSAGMSDDQIRLICERLGIQQSLFE
jgi:rhamnulose-1-phosphate aldolase